MALSFECDDCGRRWPNSREWSICPECRTRCRTAVVSTVMTAGEAKEQLRRVKFERMYAERERQREERGEPSPEEVGRRQAFELITKWHEVRVSLTR